MVMVWAAITAYGRSPLLLIYRGVRINAEYYRKNMLKDALKPRALKHFGHRTWTFQQDTALSHSARHPRMVKKLGSLLHFHRTMANKISECRSVGLLSLGYFGKQSVTSKKRM